LAQRALPDRVRAAVFEHWITSIVQRPRVPSSPQVRRSAPLSGRHRVFLWLVLLVFVAIVASVPTILSQMGEREITERGLRELSRALDQGRSFGLSRTELVVFIELASLPPTLFGGIIGIVLTLLRSPHTPLFWRAYLGIVGIVAIMELIFFLGIGPIADLVGMSRWLFIGIQIALLVFCGTWLGFWSDASRHGDAFGGERAQLVALWRDPLALLPLSALLGVGLWVLYRTPTTDQLLELGQSMLALFTFS
jgi:hypothetical protein